MGQGLSVRSTCLPNPMRPEFRFSRSPGPSPGPGESGHAGPRVTWDWFNSSCEFSFLFRLNSQHPDTAGVCHCLLSPRHSLATPVLASTACIQNVPREPPGRAGPASGPGHWDSCRLARAALTAPCPCGRSRAPARGEGSWRREASSGTDSQSPVGRCSAVTDRPAGRRGEGRPVASWT